MKSNQGFNSKSAVLTMTSAAISVALIIGCTMISIPAVVPFTLQTFAIFMISGIFGAKVGSLSVVIYILLGLVGIPVFAGQKSGIAVVMGPTGGYLIGFIFCILICTLFKHIRRDSNIVMLIGWIIGITVCYLFGTIWFCTVYTRELSKDTFLSALSVCVIPFIVPDLLKMSAALCVVDRITLPLKKIGFKLDSPRAYKQRIDSSANTI